MLVMNLSEDSKDGCCSLSPRVLPVLLLLKVWSESGDDPCDQVELVLLLLETVLALEGVHDKAVTLESLVDKLRSMEDKSMATKFTNSVEESASSLNNFIDLFEKVLDHLLSHSADDDENSQPPLITMTPLSPVLGVFVSQCVSAYQCLTFPQVVRLHSQWAEFTSHNKSFSIGPPKKVTEDKVKAFMEKQDYMSALGELTLPRSGDLLELGDAEERRERDPSSDALRVATLHAYFGHKEEGAMAINEAIRLALQDNNTKLLQHCLAWLHRLQPFSGEDVLSVLERLTSKALELQQPLLAGWARLEESKTLLKLGKDPKQVIQVAMSAGSGDCIPVYGPGPGKATHKGATLAALAKIWDHYGFSHMSRFYCRLQGNVMSCDPPPTELEGRESCVVSVSLTARHLLNLGEYSAMKALFKSAKRLLESSGKSFKLLSQCVEELGFDWSVQTGAVGVARSHLTRLRTLDTESALLRSGILSAALEDYTEARQLALQLLRASPSSPQARQRAIELLAEVECVCGRPSLSLPHLMDSLALCRDHSLSPHTTQLWLAQAQLQLESPYACARLATRCLLHFQACGDVFHGGLSQFLLAQATLLTAHQQRGKLESQDVLETIPALETAVADFQKVSATAYLHKAALLLAMVYERTGQEEKMEKMRRIALHTTTTNTHPLSYTHTTL